MMHSAEFRNESFCSATSTRAVDVEPISEDMTIVDILKKFFFTGFPLTIATLAQLTFISVIVAVIGRTLGVHELGGASLALGLINATAFAFATGLCGALETLLSHAYGLHQRKTKAEDGKVHTMYIYGTYTQRMAIILLVVSVPLGFIVVYIDKFLELIGQNPQVVKFTGRFCHIAVFGIPSVQIFQLLCRYYACQHSTTPLSTTMMVACVCNPILQLLAIKWLGFDGSPVAWLVMFTCIDCSLLCHAYFTGFYKQSWGGWDEHALKNIRGMLKLALPSMAMMMSEWVALEVNCIAAGFAKPEELAAFMITAQVLGVLWGLCSGVMIITCVFIGSAIGEGKPLLGKRIANVAIGVTLCTSICNIIICHILEDYIPLLFSNEEAVAANYRRIVRFVYPYHLVDVFQSVVMSILRGCALQKLGSIIIAGALCVVGLPSGFVLFFYFGHGVESLWIGPFLGILIVGVPSYIYLVYWYIDWPNLKPHEEDQHISEEEVEDEDIVIEGADQSTSVTADKKASPSNFTLQKEIKTNYTT